MTAHVTCSVCGRAQDKSVDPVTRKFRCELRPYGANGSAICFQCMTGDPSRETEAIRQFGVKLAAAGDVAVLDGKTVRPATEREEREVIRRSR